MMLYNPFIVIPLVSWVLAQFLKFVIRAAYGEKDFRLLYNSGGMPSAHTAVVVSLATTSLLLTGFGSPIFGITAVLAAIVVYDALGVRRAAGDQGRALRALLENARTVHSDPVRSYTGHTPLEVIAGSFVGFLTTIAFLVDNWGHQLEFLSRPPVTAELFAYLGVFAAITLIGSVAQLLLMGKSYRSLKVTKGLKRIWGWGVQVPGAIGLLLVFASRQGVATFEWRIWPALLLLLLLIIHSWAWTSYYQRVPEIIEKQKAERRQKKQERKRRNKRK